MSGYQGKKYFCDRQNESQSLTENILNGRSTTLAAIRRIGKTGLIHHVLRQLPKGHRGIYIDILPTENLNELLNKIGSAVFNTIPEQKGIGGKILDFIKSLRPIITYDPLTGQPQLSFDVRPGNSNRHIESIIHYLEKYPEKIVIAIDEFQQIMQYSEKNTEAWFRSIIQPLNNVTFVFSGSQQHLMAEMFSNPARPFFQSTSFLGIGKIEAAKYSAFIQRHFKNAGKNISEEVISEMLDWSDLHTYYVQLLCNRVFADQTAKFTSATWRKEADRLLREHEMIFFKYRDLLSKQQWLLLKAMAREGQVFEPTSKNFIRKYDLGSPSTILRSLEALLSKEMIYYDFTPEGDKYYCVYDILFRRWMDREN